MAGFKSTFQGCLFHLQIFKKILAACVARDNNVENEAYLYRKLHAPLTFVITKGA
jgi:hypothetical protein